MARQDIMASAIRKVFSDRSNRYNLEWLLECRKLPPEFYEAVWLSIPEHLRPERKSTLKNDYSKFRQEIQDRLKKTEPVSGQIDLLPKDHDQSKIAVNQIRPLNEWVTRDDVIKIVKDILADLQPEPVILHKDKLLPIPERVRVGRKETRVHAALGTCVDIRLKELFEQECRRLRMSQSELLDQILYTYFQGPKLSYE